MEPDPFVEQRRLGAQPGAGKFSRRFLFRACALVFIACAGVFSYTLLDNVEEAMGAPQAAARARIVQLDVFNGCGTNGIGAKVTSFLRTQGFDVVETKNYKSFKVPQTIVIDRVGDLAAARRVAATLGISEDRVIQELNREYFVDVSVVVGSDHAMLRITN